MIKFWTDSWIPNIGPLSQLIGIGSFVDESKTFSDFVSNNGPWSLHLVDKHIPSLILNRIKAMNPPHGPNVPHCSAWGLTNDGEFSMATTFEAMYWRDRHPHKKLFAVVWSWTGPERIWALLWKISHEAFMTNSNRFRMGISISDRCSICFHEEESQFHVFHDCVGVKEAWTRLLGLISLSSTFFG